MLKKNSQNHSYVAFYEKKWYQVDEVILEDGRPKWVVLGHRYVRADRVKLISNHGRNTTSN